jgi:hypothetical protein
VPFHVELRGSGHRAWLFNLDGATLRGGILAAWSSGVAFDAADHTWDPRDTLLRIIESPPLDPAELSYGQGWNAAERRGRDVTRDLLGSPGHRSATVVSPTRAGYEIGLGLLRELGFSPRDWGPAREALLKGAAPGVEFALVIATAEPGPWLFDAGLALGALGERAALVADGPDAPALVAGVAVLPADAAALGRAWLGRDAAAPWTS